MSFTIRIASALATLVPPNLLTIHGISSPAHIIADGALSAVAAGVMSDSSVFDLLRSSTSSSKACAQRQTRILQTEKKTPQQLSVHAGASLNQWLPLLWCVWRAAAPTAPVSLRLNVRGLQTEGLQRNRRYFIARAHYFFVFFVFFKTWIPQPKKSAPRCWCAVLARHRRNTQRRRQGNG